MSDKPTIAAIIVGIDNWHKYTLPLIKSIQQHEPDCDIVVIDNASETPYPETLIEDDGFLVIRTERFCYSEAINTGHAGCGLHRISGHDWYIVLSNDVLCTGPFADVLAGYGDDEVVGPLLKEVQLGKTTFPYLEGWCVCTSARMWKLTNGWDSKFVGSSWEDVSHSTDARLNGGTLIEDADLPFIHLDQRQRFHVIPDYWSTENANIHYFANKYRELIG